MPVKFCRLKLDGLKVLHDPQGSRTIQPVILKSILSFVSDLPPAMLALSDSCFSGLVCLSVKSISGK